MTHSATHARSERGDILGRFAAFLKSSGESLDAYRVYRRTHAELDRLSDRDLADLGISRSMITSIATEAAYGPR